MYDVLICYIRLEIFLLIICAIVGVFKVIERVKEKPKYDEDLKKYDKY